MIWCCKDCNRPQKNEYCHGSCEEYKRQKAEHDAQREVNAKQRYTQNQLNQQTADGVNRAKRHERRTRKWFA